MFNANREQGTQNKERLLLSVNPATGSKIARYYEHSDEEIDRRLDGAVDAFAFHRVTSFSDRAARMMRVAHLLEGRTRELGEIMTREMGKPIRQSAAEAEKCAWACRYYSEHAEGFLADEHVETNGARTYVAYQPLGPILAVMPWNFPFWQVFRFAVPALMAGNVVLLKHASNVTGCALAIEDLMREAGFDRRQFQTLLVRSEKISDIIADERVRGATL
ncbi:MAG: aldehyde dehydrogenase family protein, partial [Rhodothermales bacterium]